MATETSVRHDPTADLVRVVGLHAALVGVPLLIVLFVIVPWWAAIILAVVVAAGVTAWRLRDVDARLGQRLRASEIASGTNPRLDGLAEHTAMAVGVPVPTLFVIDDAAANAVVWGSGHGSTNLALTRGLIEALAAIELEAVVARQLVVSRHGLEQVTVATALFGFLADTAGASLVSSITASEHERPVVRADLEAARATQYPPALVAALEKIATIGTLVDGGPKPLHGWWLASPMASDADDVFDVHPPIEDRVDLLREI